MARADDRQAGRGWNGAAVPPDTGAPARPPFLPLGPSAFRVLALGTVVLGLMIGVLGVQLYRAAWEDAWGEVNDKHRVLAVNLANAVASYVRDRRFTVASIAAKLGNEGGLSAPLDDERTHLLDTLRQSVDGIRSVALLDLHGQVLYSGSASDVTAAVAKALADSAAFYHVVAGGTDYQDGVSASPFDGLPTVTLGWPVRDPGGGLVGVLLVGLSTAPIEALRAQVHFGEGGHALVVDQRGRLLAHPSAIWRREMRDLSALKAVRLVLAGGSGVTEFYAPFAEKRMVAGYAAATGLGWGVIVPQPMGEIAAAVRRVLYGQLAWAALGLGLLALLAYGIAHWVTRPLNGLTGGLDDRRRKE